MESQLIKQLNLENGLCLEFHDLSRSLPGNRWYLELKVRIPIPVEMRWFGGKLAAPTDFDALRQALGERVVFEHSSTRHYVKDDDKAAIFSRMQADLKANFQQYFNHPDFAAGFLTKLYKEHLKLPPGVNA
ncbi:MAG: hypothetical protein PVI90_12750 [Desulfobacteraceae bacterium]|jgi:hypothetical protein